MRRSGFRVRSLLLVVAALPLCGVFWFAFGQVSDARRQVEVSEQLDAEVNAAAKLTELQVALTAEGVWSGLLSALDVLGLDEAMAASFIGINFRAELEMAEITVDLLVEETNLQSARQALAVTRGTPPDVVRDYNEAVSLVAAERRAAQRGVTATVVDSAGSSALLTDVTSLEHSSDLWLALSKQLQLFLSLQFSQFSDGFDPTMLAVARGEYRQALEALEVQAETNAELSARLTELRDSESHQAINAAVDDYLVRISAGLGAGNEEVQLIEAGLLLGVTSDSAELHGDLLAFTSETTNLRVADQAARAAQRSDQAWLLVIMVGLASVGLVAVVAGQINRPLRALAESAEALNDGRLHAVTMASGPRETRIVGDAIGETANLLALVERQAEALAVGDLEDPILSSVVPGSLGASLQGAVAKLTSSLADRAEFERLLRYEADHDALTGLANRRAAMRYVDELEGFGGRGAPAVAVLLMDLDGFKKINDAHGHHAGDHVLKTVADRLRNCVRREDLVARVGGDEFMVLIRDQPSIVEATAARIVAAIAEPIEFDVVELEVGISVGIAESDGAGPIDIDALLLSADAASYRAKSEGGGAVARHSVQSPTGRLV